MPDWPFYYTVAIFTSKKFSQLISTLTYTFASYALYAGMHHAFFLLPLILFPLLANGIEQVLHRHAVVPLIIAVTITFLSNFYFAYILGLGCLVYVIVRYFDLRTSKSFRPWKSLLSLTAAVIAGLGMAAVLFVPTIMYAFQSTRITNQFANGYHLYPLSYYLGLPGKIIGMGNSFNFWLIIGISGFSLLAIIYVLSHFRKYRALNWSLILLGIGIVFPQVSAIFNAFAAPSNRWLSLGLLPIGLASAYFAEALRHLTHRDLAILAASGPSLLLVIWLSNGGILKLHRHDLVEYLLFFSLIGILLIANLFNWKRRWLQSSVLTLVIVNLISLGIGFYSPNSSSYSKTMYLQNQAQQAVSNYYDQADHYVTPRLNHERTTIGPRYHYQPDQRKKFFKYRLF
nr:YfhO family protein [Fructilactobacillus florum]